MLSRLVVMGQAAFLDGQVFDLLTRLKNDAAVVNMVGKWFLAEAVKSTVPPTEHPVSIKESAPHDGGALDL